MSVDYGAYVFFGLRLDEIPNPDDEYIQDLIENQLAQLRTRHPSADLSKVGYLYEGDHMSGPIRPYLVYGGAYGGDFHYGMGDGSPLYEGIRLTGSLDEEFASAVLAEVCEALGWPFEKPGWFRVGSVS